MKDQADEQDDGMLKVTVLRKTLFFLALVSDPQREAPALSGPLQEMARDLFGELAIEINNCISMRSVLLTLTEVLGAAEVMEILGGSPDDINRIRSLLRGSNQQMQTRPS